MINLNNVYENYISFQESKIKEKINLFETFSKKEEELRDYEEALSVMDKTAKNVNLNVFKKIRKKMFTFLFQKFDTEYIRGNVERTKAIERKLKEKEQELKKLSETLSFIVKTWEAFIKRRNFINKKSLFIEEIFLKMEETEKQFKKCDLDDIGRLEEFAEEIKQEILKIINMFEYLYSIKEKYVFIGKEAQEIEKDINLFLDKDFFESSVLELIKRKENIQSILSEILKNETEYIKKRFQVVKIIHKEKVELVSYSIKINDDYILATNMGEINKEIYNVIELDKYIYIDNYPSHGIFEAAEIGKLMNISLNQFETMIEFEQKSSKLFYFLLSVSFILILLSLFNIVDIMSLLFLLLFFYGSFTFSFKYLLKKTNTKYEVEDAFFFIPLNYYLVKEGNSNLNYKDLVFYILDNAEKTIFKGEKNG